MDGIWFKPIFLETWVLLDSLPVNRRAITYLDLRKGINPLAFFVLYLEFESWLMRYYSFTGNWRLFTFYENSFAITPNLNPKYCDILASKEATRLTQDNHISRPMKKYKFTLPFHELLRLNHEVFFLYRKLKETGYQKRSNLLLSTT